MAIFQRIGTLLRSNVNDMINKSEDPEKMLNQMLLDMQEQLVEAKKQVAVAIADEKRLRAQYEKESLLAQEREKRAMLAVQSGKDDLAKQALERKAEHAKQAHAFDQQWQSQKAAVDQLKAALQQLSNKIGEAKRKKNLLIARAKRAEAQQTIAETLSGISENSAFDTIARMEEKIDRMEAEASATQELASSFGGDTLEKQFDDLAAVETDDALLALKAKMGITAPVREAAATETMEESDLEEIEKQIHAELAAKR